MGNSREELLTTTLRRHQLFNQSQLHQASHSPTSPHPGLGARTGPPNESSSSCSGMAFTSGMTAPSSGSSGNRSLHSRRLLDYFQPFLNVFPLRESGADHSCLQARGGVMNQTFQCVYLSLWIIKTFRLTKEHLSLV